MSVVKVGVGALWGIFCVAAITDTIQHGRGGPGFLRQAAFGKLTDQPGYTGHWDWRLKEKWFQHYVPDSPDIPRPADTDTVKWHVHTGGGYEKHERHIEKPTP